MKKIGFILMLTLIFPLLAILGNNTSAQDDPCNGMGVYNSMTDTCEQIQADSTTDQTQQDTTVNGITIGSKCLLNGQCKFNIYDTLGIRNSVRSEGDPTSVGIFVQDIILAATTFIGTILTLAIIISGLMYIFAAASGKDPAKAKSGLINSLIGLAIVALSYSIVRLVQYLAKGF